MASKFGEVMDIETADSYMKRPACPMVIIEVKEITKLAEYIRIPSMVEGTSAMDTIHQRIFYSGLPNQCRKCRKFGHHAQICNTNRLKPREGSTHHNAPRSTNAKKAPDSRPPSQDATFASKSGPPWKLHPTLKAQGAT
ncbi:unnamed protein product [Sphagnum jensenii]|uniref:DUF4283 domain-containing protein n=1 Tax=Sphagnum jensenii TaxID=128206 RepID=A0ABP1AT24_9BRYO